jgi:hypothetical protein
MSKITNTKRASGVVQDESSKFKPLYWGKKNKTLLQNFVSKSLEPVNIIILTEHCMAKGALQM